MDIHEYQAKKILKKYGVPVSEFSVISSVDEVKKAAEHLKLDRAVLKVQVHAGGRGKAGGVKIANNLQEMEEVARHMLGMKIVNAQTGSQGIIAKQLLLTPVVEIKREFYLAATIDRKKAQAMLIASPEGGMEIEKVAAQNPEKILTVPITSSGQVRSYNILRIANFLGWKNEYAEQGKKIIQAIAKAFIETDASLLEINPLVETTEAKLVALDAKLSVDDNALFRQPEIASFYDPSQIRPEEVEAKAYDLAYVALDGGIGCMVNGAGLAMATMDIIHLYGGSPANFLDVGGGASQDKVAAGFRIILSDPKVKAILVNIFGGIMNCETLALGIIAAANELEVNVPLVVRMEGTNVDKGKKILQESGLNLVVAASLADAAEKVVNATKH